MRTAEQIENLRVVLERMIGSFAYVLPAELVDSWATTLQNRLNGVHTWEIKVSLYDDQRSSWEKIEPEPVRPTCSPEAIFNKCGNLMAKYPDIRAMRITIVGETLKRSFDLDRTTFGL